MFVKGDRVICVKGAARIPRNWPPYEGVEGIVISDDGKYVWFTPDKRFLDERPGCARESWQMARPRYELALIDEPVIEEDWS